MGMPESAGNDLTDRLASTSDITSGLQCDGAEVLGVLRNFLNIDRPEHNSTCMEEEWRKEAVDTPP